MFVREFDRFEIGGDRLLAFALARVCFAAGREAFDLLGVCPPRVCENLLRDLKHRVIVVVQLRLPQRFHGDCPVQRFENGIRAVVSIRLAVAKTAA